MCRSIKFEDLLSSFLTTQLLLSSFCVLFSRTIIIYRFFSSSVVLIFVVCLFLLTSFDKVSRESLKTFNVQTQFDAGRSVIDPLRRQSNRWSRSYHKQSLNKIVQFILDLSAPRLNTRQEAFMHAVTSVQRRQRCLKGVLLISMSDRCSASDWRWQGGGQDTHYGEAMLCFSCKYSL